MKWFSLPRSIRDKIIDMRNISALSILFLVLAFPAQAGDSDNRSSAKPFSYYAGEGWRKDIDNFNVDARKIGWNFLMTVGSKGVDGIRDHNDDNMRIDGLFYSRVEVYDFNNLHHNNISIMAPGLIDLVDDTLQVVAEPQLDTVTLDGCLNWKNQKQNDDYAYWEAVDSEKVKRLVKISKGVPVSIEKTCDSGYLAKDMENAPPPKPVGGVVAFNLNDLNPKGIELYILKPGPDFKKTGADQTESAPAITPR